MKNSTSKSNLSTQIVLCIVAGILGYMLLFVKEVTVVTHCQIFCGGLIAVGVVAIVSYFLSGDYKRLDRYGFSYGILLCLLGCIGFLRMDSLTANFEIYIGILSLILGVLTLQGAVQVKVLNYSVWIVNLIFALVLMAGSFIILLDITAISGMIPEFSGWLLLISGVVCLLSLIITGVSIFLAGRRSKKEEDQPPKPDQYPKPEDQYPRPADPPAEDQYPRPADPPVDSADPADPTLNM